MAKNTDFTPKAHVWEDHGPTAAPYCQDCNKSTNAAREIRRARHYLYVCPICAMKRLAAPAIFLQEKDDA